MDRIQSLQDTCHYGNRQYCLCATITVAVTDQWAYWGRKGVFYLQVFALLTSAKLMTSATLSVNHFPEQKTAVLLLTPDLGLTLLHTWN